MNAHAACLAGRAEFNFGPMSAAPVVSREFFTGVGSPSAPPIMQADLRLIEDLFDTYLAERLLDESRPEDYISLEELNRTCGR